MNQGILYGVSVGTGDPELLTVKAVNLLQNSSVIAFPAGIKGKPGIAQTIIQPWLKSSQTLLPLNFPYTRNQEILMAAWQKCSHLIWQYLQAGEDVVFACEGDISFYSTFNYLAETILTNYPSVKIIKIPGVCSPMAAAAVLGIPLTINEQKLAIIPALYNTDIIEQALNWSEVIVLMKISSVYSQVWQILQEKQLLNKSYVVEWATLPQQKIYRNLSNYPELKLSYFSLLIVQQ